MENQGNNGLVSKLNDSELFYEWFQVEGGGERGWGEEGCINACKSWISHLKKQLIQ